MKKYIFTAILMAMVGTWLLLANNVKAANDATTPAEVCLTVEGAKPAVAQAGAKMIVFTDRAEVKGILRGIDEVAPPPPTVDIFAAETIAVVFQSEPYAQSPVNIGFFNSQGCLFDVLQNLSPQKWQKVLDVATGQPV